MKTVLFLMVFLFGNFAFAESKKEDLDLQINNAKNKALLVGLGSGRRLLTGEMDTVSGTFLAVDSIAYVSIVLGLINSCSGSGKSCDDTRKLMLLGGLGVSVLSHTLQYYDAKSIGDELKSKQDQIKSGFILKEQNGKMAPGMAITFTFD